MVSCEIVQLTDPVTDNYSLSGEIWFPRMVTFKNFIIYILQFFRQTPKINKNGPAKETVLIILHCNKCLVADIMLEEIWIFVDKPK